MTVTVICWLYLSKYAASKSTVCFECQAAFMDEEHFQKALHTSAGLNGDEALYGMEDWKPVTFFEYSVPLLVFNMSAVLT